MNDVPKKAAVLDHILRYPFPWRTDALTECGKAQDAVKQSISRDEFRRRVKDWGEQRTAFTVCMTCADRARYSRPWDVDPVNVVEREVQRVQYNSPEERARFTDELRAIAALIEAHRDEFDGYLSGLADTTDLAARRLAKRRAQR